jgi:hypothetical protein
VVSPVTTRRSDAPALSEARLLAELTIRLHDGPLYSMAAVYREAAALALASEAASEAGRAFDVARLAQLAQIAQSALARFQAFTGDLDKLVGELAARPFAAERNADITRPFRQ